MVSDIQSFDAFNFKRISCEDLRRKISRNEGHNERRRANATRTWQLWFLPAVRDLHAIRAARVGDKVEGVMIRDEDHLQFEQEDARRRARVHYQSALCELKMIPVNDAWIAAARRELEGRIA